MLIAEALSFTTCSVILYDGSENMFKVIEIRLAGNGVQQTRLRTGAFSTILCSSFTADKRCLQSVKWI